MGEKPGWLTLDPTGKYIFSTDEVSNFQGKKDTGGVYSGQIDSDGVITAVSSAKTGSIPAAAQVSPDGRFLLVASYAGAAVDLFKIEKKSEILSSEPVQTVHLHGSGPNTQRQRHAFAHQAVYDKGGRLAFVPDLGADKLRIFEVNDPSGRLSEVEPVIFPPGTGPRHLVIVENFIYVVCELSSRIFILKLDRSSQDGHKAEIIGALGTLPTDANADNFGAGEIAASPDGHFIYATNRPMSTAGPIEDNTFAVFARSSDDGMLDSPTFYPVGGRTARHFAISHDTVGRFVVVGAVDSNLVIIHRRDPMTGALMQIARTKVKKPSVQIFAI
ncbi:uncharacterized protein MELLADRAFT_88798 [Melampsora larici-populina 98AG31]|uniref:3-carboxymuconate cyclase n=1 Tax=Melampsora larici-populina (strain 98AG31 / pathotype 3-4-7) TaxID=747676 RepID=F4RT10_MELLP|nr:uncharacterized protein MELLADRAFT_88798 [Melampsora larici-populina 98AG31]EGG04423.1 hypothetical protein MELLADRAFT_88798 [Melampsora larici-populina 98AG31]